MQLSFISKISHEKFLQNIFQQLIHVTSKCHNISKNNIIKFCFLLSLYTYQEWLHLDNQAWTVV